ncbi:MAG: InlB B-repeat-containing protein [Clostridia bacterium]|nr:InlB B-repeat-containing protein [Clostridia bacterium]
MKKFFSILLIAVALVLIVFTFAACNDKPTNETPEEEKPIEYETVTYTVNFVGGPNEDAYWEKHSQTVEAGEKVVKPGVDPKKTGNNFSCWTLSGGDGVTEFDFANTAINSDITLRAVFIPIVYRHTVDLTAKLVSEEVNGKTVYGVQRDVYHNFEEMAEDNIPSSQFGESSGSHLAIPTTTDPLDRFLFWYYIDKTTKLPVKFSSQASAGATYVTQAGSYNFTEGLELYAMWYSMLPKITVVYNDSLGVDEPYYSKEYAQVDYVPDVEAPDMAAAVAASESKDGKYLFDKWYYLAEIDGKETKLDFVFDLTDDENATPTSLASASGLSQWYESATLNLYASWKKLVSIATVADFEEKLYNVMHGENTLEAEKDAVTKAIIKIGNDEMTIDFGSKEYKPLFDAEHKFVGEIDGGKYSNTALTAKTVLTGGVFGDETSASVFGYVAGTIKNLDFVNVGLKFSATGSGVDFLAGAIATENHAIRDGENVVSLGSILNCSVTFDALAIEADGSTVEDGYLKNGFVKVVFGGAVARNVGGKLTNTTVRMNSVAVLAQSVLFGGLTADNTASGVLSGADVEVNLTSARAIYQNSRPSAKIGGLVGKNSGTITRCTATINCVAMEGKNLDFGGIAGENIGSVALTHATATLASAGAPARVGTNVNVGGLVGMNEGYVKNVYAIARLYVLQDANGAVAVGGLVGNNYMSKDLDKGETNSGAVNGAYATGGVVVNVQSGVSATAYVGGLIGKTNAKHLAKDFAVVDVSLTNAGTNNVGRLLGSKDDAWTLNELWYAQENTLILNGEATSGLAVGTATEGANFESGEFVIGSTSTVKLDSDIWEISGGLPTLK